MLIAISQKLEKNKHGNSIDVLESSYILFLEQFGITLIPVPNLTQQVDNYFDPLSIEGIILTGGNDIDPRLYGENIEWPDITPPRDETEKKIMERAVQKRIPVLGICRGAQFINVFFGGKSVKNIKNDLQKEHPLGKDHTLIIIDKIAQKTLGSRTEVNSYHNQAITIGTLASPLRVFAENDGIVEGMYHPHLPIAGIQWHPERKSPNSEINEKLLKAFVNRELFWKK